MQIVEYQFGCSQVSEENNKTAHDSLPCTLHKLLKAVLQGLVEAVVSLK